MRSETVYKTVWFSEEEEEEKKKKERSIPFEFITVCTISPAQPISLKITFNIVLFLEFRTKEKQR